MDQGLFCQEADEIELTEDNLKRLPKWWSKAGKQRREEWLFRTQAIARRGWYDDTQPHSNVEMMGVRDRGEFIGNLRFWYIITGEDFMDRYPTGDPNNE